MTKRAITFSWVLAASGWPAFWAIGTTTAIDAQPSDKTTAPAVAQPKGDTKQADPAYNGPPVLDPAKFVGNTQMGYAATKAAPEVASHVFCYCGCDIQENHRNLIDCFTGIHAADCSICQEEAVIGLKLKRQGKSIAEIQKEIDHEYARQYPFSQPSANFKAYQASRLYADDHKDTNEATAPLVKPGFSVGKCCAGENKAK